MVERYLDSIAKSFSGEDVPSVVGDALGACGRWSAVGHCEDGHMVSRTILCGREWCEVCGANNSDAHKRRWVRWLPKAQQLHTLGYMVVTFPPSFRENLHSAAQLSEMGKHLTQVLRSLGFHRGLRRWHYFGDKSTTFHPHLNFILDSGWIPQAELQYIHQIINEAVGIDCVMQYQYTTVTGEMLHILSYVTRATFLQWQWDVELSIDLKGSRNCWAWGKWNGAPVWAIEPTEVDLKPGGVAVLRGQCPHCFKPLTWGKLVHPSSVMALLEPTALGGGLFLLSSTLHLPVSLDPTSPYFRPF